MKRNLVNSKKSMTPAKEIFTEELENFTKKYDSIGRMQLREEPDLDTMDYIYSFEKVNGTTSEELDQILTEIYDHMEKFSNEKDINKFCQNTIIWL